MKKLLFMFILPTLLLAGCSKDDTGGKDAHHRVQFTAGMALQTRVGGNDGAMWDGGEQVGIYMLQNAAALVSNAPYTASAGEVANLTPAGDPIYYPADGSEVQFISYYPYAEIGADMILPVSVADQTDPSAIDLLYAPISTAQNSGTVELGYEHQLAKLAFTLQPGGDLTAADLAGATISIAGQQTQAQFDLNDGTLTVTAGTPTALAASMLADGTSGQAIVLPNAASGMVFTVEAAGHTYATNPLPADAEWESGLQYNYNITLGDSEVTMTGTITEWNDGGTTDLTGTERDDDQGLDLSLTLVPGDENGANTSTMVYMTIQSALATSCDYLVAQQSMIDQLSAQGVDVSDANAVLNAWPFYSTLTSSQITQLNSPEGYSSRNTGYFAGQNAYAYVRVKDADGNSVGKMAMTTTTTGLELTLSGHPGDLQGENTTTCITVTVQSPTAIGGDMTFVPRSTVDQILLLYPDVDPNDYSAILDLLINNSYPLLPEDIVEVNSAEGYTFQVSGYKPGEEACVIVRVFDTEGNTLTKSIPVTTNEGEPLEQIDLGTIEATGGLERLGNAYNEPKNDYCIWCITFSNATANVTLEVSTNKTAPDLVPGTYTMVPYQEQLGPFTMVPGFDSGGGLYFGTFVSEPIFSPSTDGTVTVSKSGDIYTLELDLQDVWGGYEFTGTFTGKLTMVDHTIGSISATTLRSMSAPAATQTTYTVGGFRAVK